MTFTFSLPINEARNTASGFTQIFHGDVEITATVTKGDEQDPDVEVESIKWGGRDILPMLDNFPEGLGDEIRQYCLTAALEHARNYQPEKYFV